MAPYDTDVASWLCYLNRSGFNGLYRVNRDGGYNVPMGNSQQALPAGRLQRVSELLAGVEFQARDWRVSLEPVQASDLVYLDPPFVGPDGGGFAEYTAKRWTWKDQVDLAEAACELRARGVHVVVSNLHHIDVRRLYAPFSWRAVQVRRSINRHGDGRQLEPELLLY